ncbi:hypothetical protein JYT20_01690, partial [Rhodothermus sp. AH-315-K08]|nr:hypothetical protein [Rhodothermus sp. AH-315-K08]
MGKAALFLVAAVSLASGASYLNQDRTAFEGEKNEALYEHQVLAREIAQSGFNRIESRVRRDFNGHRAQLSGLDHPKGELDITATGSSGSPVSISATGYFEDAEHTITATLSKQGTRVLDAFTLDGIASDVSFASTALISGLDTNPDGTSGTNQDVHAVMTMDSGAYAEFVSEIPSGRAPGMAGPLDVVDTTPEVNLASLSARILAFAGPTRVDYDGETTLNSETLGTAQNPAVVVVNGDLTLTGSTIGYGVLYAGGDLIFEDDSRWIGLVMVENNGGTHAFRNDSRVYGAVVVRSVYAAVAENGDDLGLAGGHFDVDVFDEFGQNDRLYHEHKYDDKFDVTGLDLLDPAGCKSGGLCWDQILGGEDAVYVEFFNAEMGYGTFDIQAGAGSVGDECPG